VVIDCLLNPSYHVKAIGDFSKWSPCLLSHTLKTCQDSPLRQRNITVAIHQLLTIGQSIFTEDSRTPCRVEKFLGGGGQGEVYQANMAGKPVAIKWYFPRTATVEQRVSLENLVRQSSPNQRFLWPQEMVSDPKLRGFGYVMGLRGKEYCGIIDLMKRRISPSFRSLITAGYQLADSYYQLHSKGLCYRDISFANVFFNPQNGDVLICDNDNVAINNSPVGGILGTPRFMAPEVVRRESHPNRDTDLYSLAVLLFYILLIQHPLEGKKELAIKCLDLPALEKLYGFEPLFIFDPEDDSNRPDPVVHLNANAFWPIYPQLLQNLFIRSFTTGLTDPKHGRVKETEWRNALVQLRDAIFQCQCGADNFFDVDRDSGNQQACWSCQQVLRVPIRLQFQGKRFVVLNQNTELFPHHLDNSAPFQFGSRMAEVTRHPADPNIWGIKNHSSEKWVATNAEGALHDVLPGSNVKLARGLKIQFGNVTGVIE
jgi:DNA-binding helix-hairpin-helix protein with protein kinase domain